MVLDVGTTTPETLTLFIYGLCAVSFCLSALVLHGMQERSRHAIARIYTITGVRTSHG